MIPLLVVSGLLTCLALIFLGRVARLGEEKKSVFRESVISEIGEAQMSIDPEGFVSVRGRTYRARGTAPIAACDRVCVIGAGKILIVKPYSL